MSNELILSIPGMACCSCVANIEHVLKEHEGVGKVAIDFDSKTAAINASVPADVLITAIKTAGYEAKQIN